MAVGQVGYKSRFYRGATQVNHCRKIDPPIPTRAKIDATDLESANFTKEYIQGFIDPPEITIEFKYDSTNVQQNLLHTDFLAGTAAVENWKYELRDPVLDTVLLTMSFAGYISGCSIGPIEAETLVLLQLKIQISGAITPS